MPKVITIAVLGERWPGDFRVMLLPQHLALLVDAGCRIIVESGVASHLGISNEDYIAAGATIHSVEYCYANADIVAKYKAPHVSEWQYMRPGLHVACYVYLEFDRNMTESFCHSGASIYGFTYYQNEDGQFPVSQSDNEMTGKMAVIYGAYHLQSHLGGRGVFLGHTAGNQQPRVLVIGHGRVGAAAARTAVALGNNVTVLGRSAHRLRVFEGSLNFPVRALLNDPETLRREISEADVVIGAIRDSVPDTEAMVDHQTLKCMKKGAVFIDTTCGYGAGYLPTFHSFTTQEEPSYMVDGVVHIKIDKMPMSYPLTSSMATGWQAQLFLKSLAESISDQTENVQVNSALLIQNGKVCHSDVQRNMKLLWPDFQLCETG